MSKKLEFLDLMPPIELADFQEKINEIIKRINDMSGNSISLEDFIKPNRKAISNKKDLYEEYNYEMVQALNVYNEEN